MMGRLGGQWADLRCTKSNGRLEIPPNLLGVKEQISHYSRQRSRSPLKNYRRGGEAKRSRDKKKKTRGFCFSVNKSRRFSKPLVLLVSRFNFWLSAGPKSGALPPFAKAEEQSSDLALTSIIFLVYALPLISARSLSLSLAATDALLKTPGRISRALPLDSVLFRSLTSRANRGK